MKTVLFSLVAVSLLATTLISCQSNQKGTAEGGDDTTTTTKATSASTTTKPSGPSIAATGSPILDVSPAIKVKAPQFSNEDVNAGFAKFEPLKEEYSKAIASNDAAKIKEVTAKYNAWVLEASKWGSKLPSSENQIYIDHYTTLTTQWDKLSLKVKK
ncbi:hypothetical protein WG904_00575 [Pedobacter sp. Du54]|uniref:hypothetical protein n=1 Tax=Pedobacter anseongensis TaxID=3133439 RepID=UPI0030B4431D